MNNHFKFNNMKNKIKNTLFLLVSFVCVAVMLSACQENYTGKYEMTDGVPIVYYVRPTNAANSDDLLLGARLGETICIVGDNLTSVQELYFNDKKAFLNHNFITKNTLIVTVPREVSEEPDDKIYLINKKGQSTGFDFIVLMPSPVIQRILCEHVPEGGDLVILGDYFFDDDPAGNPLKVKVGVWDVPENEIVDIQKTSIKFKAPPGDVTGRIQVTSIYGASARSNQIFRDMRGWITGFEPGEFDSGGWGRPTADQIQADPELALMGRYLRFEGNLAPTGSGQGNNQGYDQGMIANLWSSINSNLNDPLFTSDPINSILRFEAYVMTPWSALPMIFMFDEAGTDENWLWADGSNPPRPRGFWVPWLETGSYVGAGWETVSIPLSEMKYSATGAEIAVSESFGQLGFAIHNRGTVMYDGTAPCSPVILIDNIRVVPGN